MGQSSPGVCLRLSVIVDVLPIVNQKSEMGQGGHQSYLFNSVTVFFYVKSFKNAPCTSLLPSSSDVK